MVVRMMCTLISALFALLRAALMPRTTLALENAALRQQLAISQRTHKPTRLRAEDRVFWVALRRLWSGWTRPLVIVKPATVLGWHRKGFKALWRSKSRSGHIGRLTDLVFPASTSDSSNGSLATTPSGAKTKSPRSLPPSSVSSIPSARSDATWSGAAKRLVDTLASSTTLGSCGRLNILTSRQYTQHATARINRSIGSEDCGV
jgi:hypothetical protein